MRGDVSDVLGDRSSNRSRTTTFGSDLVLLLESDPLLVARRALVWPLLVRSPVVTAYSGRSAKLLGVTTTLYVPGRFVSAFRSRSSSFVSVAKAGKIRPESELLSGLSILTEAARLSILPLERKLVNVRSHTELPDVETLLCLCCVLDVASLNCDLCESLGRIIMA